MQVRVVLCRASRLFGYASTILFSVLPASLYGQQKTLETQNLECVRDNQGRDVASRSMQTPVFDSERGFRAYGVVVASHSPQGACTNTSTIYFAEAGGAFRVALQQKSEQLPDGSVYDGNGIESIQWSSSGTRLLIEVSQWTWGTDSTWNTKYILFNPVEGHATQLPIVPAIKRYFAHPCARIVSSNGWLDDERIGIEIKPTKYVDEEGAADPTPSCVGKPTGFNFDVDSGEFRKAQ